jgi:hypothetical protein
MCRHVPKVPYGSYAPGLEISLKGYTSYRLYKYYIRTTHYYVLFITSTTDMS